MTDLQQIQMRILAATPVLGRESVPILDSLGRVLAEDITVAEDVPSADVSAVDGYATGHDSLHGASQQAPVFLRIIGESPAGNAFKGSVGPAEAVRIMTGGMLPRGADTILKREDAVEKDGFVLCRSNPGRGHCVRVKGEALRRGDTVLPAGELIGPVEVSLLASLRHASVYVHQKPVVAILSTGDELADFHEPLAPGKVMCSNLYGLAAQVLETGAKPLCLGIAPDDLQAQQALLAQGLRADVIITSGGLSRGKYDFVRESLTAMGMQVKFTNVSLKPGKPSIFGTIDHCLIFGFPGNPTAAMISFDQFVKPALLKMMGHQPHFEPMQCGQSLAFKEGSPLRLLDSFRMKGPKRDKHARAPMVPAKQPEPQHDKRTF